MELLNRVVIGALLLGPLGCQKYENPYDPENVNKDFDGDGIKNKDDPDPRNKPAAPASNGPGTPSDASGTGSPPTNTVGTPVETSGTGSVGIPSGAVPKIEKWNITQPSVCSVAYRAANTSLYVFGNGKVSIYSLASGQPTPSVTKTLESGPSGCRRVAAWSEDGTYYLADDTHIHSFNADLDHIASVEMAFAFIATKMGGGLIEGGGIRIVTGDYTGYMRDINLITGSSNDVVFEVPTPVADGFVQVYDTLGTVVPDIDWEAGLAKTSAGYWIVVKSNAYYLVLLNGSGVPIQAYPLMASNGGAPQQITSDGQSIWVLTATQLIKVTPP